MEFEIEGTKLVKCINTDKKGIAIIPKCIKVIGTNAFEPDYYLKDIILHEGIEELEGTAFANCKKLEKIVLPNSLKMIPSWAFAGCNNLKNIEIPESVERIEFSIAPFCDDLKNIKVSSFRTFSLLSFPYRCYALHSIIKNTMKINLRIMKLMILKNL